MRTESGANISMQALVIHGPAPDERTTRVGDVPVAEGEVVR
jgi:hypothetical protein